MAMPNPDFTGTVPRMRCETCKHWRRSRGVFGVCMWSDGGTNDARTVIITTAMMRTTDLTVCSDWSKSDDADA